MAQSVKLFLKILLNWKTYSQEWSNCIMAWINHKVDHEYLAIHKHYQCKHKVCVNSWTRSQKWEHRDIEYQIMQPCIWCKQSGIALQLHRKKKSITSARRYVFKIHARELSNVPIRQTKIRSSKPSKNTTYILCWKIVTGLEIIGIIKSWLDYDYGLTLGSCDYILIWIEIKQVHSQNWSWKITCLRF